MDIWRLGSKWWPLARAADDRCVHGSLAGTRTPTAATTTAPGSGTLTRAGQGVHGGFVWSSLNHLFGHRSHLWPLIIASRQLYVEPSPELGGRG